jgi:pimeloyl-ACP methyl ester carboxylesterase
MDAGEPRDAASIALATAGRAALPTGVTIYWESLGDERNPAVVLVMGLGMHIAAWPQAFVQTLVGRGLRVIVFDNRDCGWSTSLDALGTPNVARASFQYWMGLPVDAPYRLDHMARDAVGLLDALGLERAHWVGISMGGMIVQLVAALQAQRVNRLVSMLSTSGERRYSRPSLRALRALLRPPPGDDPDSIASYLADTIMIIGSRRLPRDDGQLLAYCRAHAARASNRPGFLRQLVAVAASEPRTALLPRVTAPTLVIHGDDDPLVPIAGGRHVAQLIPGARFEAIRDLGHDLPPVLMPKLGQLIGDFLVE